MGYYCALRLAVPDYRRRKSRLTRATSKCDAKNTKLTLELHIYQDVSRLVSSPFRRNPATVNTNVNVSRIFGNICVTEVALLWDVGRFTLTTFPLSDIQNIYAKYCCKRNNNNSLYFVLFPISIGSYGKWSRLKTITSSIILAYFQWDRSPEGNRFNYIFLIITENNNTAL